MKRDTCSLSECFSPTYKRGYCRKHYRRWRRTGTTDPPVSHSPENVAAAGRLVAARNTATPVICGHSDRKHFARGLCHACYSKSRVHLLKKCTIYGCDRPATNGAICAKHWLRLTRHGTTDAPARGRSAEFLASVKPKQTAKINTCGHPNRPHAAKGMCKSCYQRAWQIAHPEAITASAWLKAHPEQARAHRRRAALKKHGINLEDYEALWAAQGGKCANPRCDERREMVVENYLFGLQVDHDHGTGRVRGLLCGHCNRVLGHAHDSVDRLRGLIEYLEQAA